jgi:hypothetical protein
MRKIYTLADLRALKVETVGRDAIIGKGKARRAFRADAEGVVFNFDRMKSEEQLKVGALIASLEKKAGVVSTTDEPATGAEAPAAPAPVKKKATAKKVTAKPADQPDSDGGAE